MKTGKTGRRGPRIVVRRSGIHGRGVFARRPLRQGETVCEYKGERVSESEIARRYPEDMDGLNHTFVFGIDHDLNIDGGVNGNIARWINHAWLIQRAMLPFTPPSMLRSWSMPNTKVWFRPSMSSG